jgi:hypothetical protein
VWSYLKKNNKKHSYFTKKSSETDIINVFEFLIDNIFAMFGGRVFPQTVGGGILLFQAQCD